MKLFSMINSKIKYINGTKGVISLFLCILLIPVLTIASALIEFARYQSVAMLTNEMANAAGLAALADYDEYLVDRFGVFATSQESDIDKNAEDIFNDSVSVLSGAVDEDNIDIEAEGAATLADIEALRRQVLDVSETSALAEIMLNDLGLEELLNELAKFKNIGDFLAVTKASADMVKAIKDLVDIAKEVIELLDNIKTTASNIDTHTSEFAAAITDLYSAVKTDMPNFNQNSDEDITKVSENYLTQIEAIYKKAALVKQDHSDLKGYIDSLIGTTYGSDGKLGDLSDKIVKAVEKAGAFQEKLDKFISATSAQNSQKDGSEKTAQDSAKENASKDAGIIVDAIKNSFADICKAYTSDKMEKVRACYNLIATSFNDELGIAGVFNTDNYTKDDEGKLPDDVVQSLRKLFKFLPVDKWEGDVPQVTLDKIKSQYTFSAIKELLKINNAPFKNAVDKAVESFESNLEGKLKTLLKNLVKMVKGLFDLEVFFDPDLRATVSMKDGDSPYAAMVDALSTLFDAFTDVIEDKKITIKVLYKLIKGVYNAFKAIWNFVKQAVSDIKEFVNCFTKPSLLYEKLLIAGYMRHMLPSRVDEGSADFDVDLSEVEVTQLTSLSGKSLTGYSYSKIKKPSLPAYPLCGLEGLAEIFTQGNNGTDGMFVGAELEYILAGTGSETANQIAVFMEIYVLRLILNLPAIITDASVNAMAASATIGAPIVYILVAIAEPLCDTILLVNGGKAAIIKGSCYVSPVGVVQLAKDLSAALIKNKTLQKKASDAISTDIQNSMSSYAGGAKFDASKNKMKRGYATHVLLMLAMKNSETSIRRFGQLLELEANYYYYGDSEDKSFDLDKAYVSIKMDVDVEFNSFLNIFEYNESSPLSGHFEYYSGY